MKILVVEPGKAPAERDIPAALASLQEIAEGTIQAIYPFEDSVALICNDEGKLMGLPANRALPEIRDIICGTFAIVGAPPNEERFVSLTEEQLTHYKLRFRCPELFLRIGDSLVVLPDV